MKITLKDVAKMAGVSPSTVSRVITKSKDLNIKDETRQRILDTIEKLDYKPNVIARSLRIKSTNTLGMIIPDITNSFFSALFKGAEKLASEKGFSIILANTDDNLAKAEKLINNMRQRQVDGLLLATTHISDDTLHSMNVNKYPHVFVNRHLNNEIESYVIVDNFLGTTLAMEHLVALGHSKIAHISGPSSVDTAFKRFEGYKFSLERNDLCYNPDLVVESEMTEEGGYKAFYELVKKRVDFTAVYAANDLIAVGLMTAAKEKGLKIPEDFSLVGFDDLPVADKTSPSLTTVKVPLHEMGYIAADILIKEIKGEKNYINKIILRPELVVRESTKSIV
ncbi:MAG: hypothetical protein HPY66_2119 [Firmicutes bacterium]|nr:hypothetical protein [Bacillota bacterium]MDI6705878.1 LacI family DNA-binding transcriptional regulator [Bacillota bacterium]